MKRLILFALLSAAVLQGTAAVGMYVGSGGGVSLPTGSSEIRRGGVGGAMLGWNVADSLSLEIAGGALEGDGFAAADALWHWTGFAFYDRYFGFSAWDPFFLGGFAAVFGDNGDYGPEAGVGLFYHLNDRWSLRFAAKSQLGIENDAAVAFAITGGIVLDF